MRRFTDAIDNALYEENWYGALSMALILPDVCGRLETPSEGVGKRYMRWYVSFVQHKYEMNWQDGKHVFLSGADCYALRCSFLHEGSGDITGQKARKVLDRFHFIIPPGKGNVIHKIQRDSALLLQTDIFCKDMIEGVAEWEKAVCGNFTVIQQKSALLKIHDVSGGFAL